VLDIPWLKIKSITGTSAGAMNAVVFAYGYMLDGPEGAKAALERFWRRISNAARYSPIQRTPIDVLTGNWSLSNSPAYIFYDHFSRLFLLIRSIRQTTSLCGTYWRSASISED
jgi:NTE family protein